ncbi:MAG: ankyrin repeat domain-containing protein [Alphaproteobacteria bacterium]|nr:ankyrin repeat domain-containing protein [Rickettsiales bacterium]
MKAKLNKEKTKLSTRLYILLIIMFVTTPIGFKFIETLTNKKHEVEVTAAIAFSYIESSNIKAIKSIPRQRLANIEDEHGRSLLMLASYIGEYKIVKYLLKDNTIINKTDQKGNTAIIYATKNDNEKTMRLLIKKGANLNQANSIGINPLIITAVDNNMLMLQLMIANGANVDNFDINMHTPLMYAIYSGNIQIAKLLLTKYNASVNIISKQGKGALEIAIEQRESSIARMIIEKTNNLARKDINSKNALELAIDANLPSVVDAILAKDITLLDSIKTNKAVTSLNQQNKIIYLIIKEYRKKYNILPKMQPNTQKLYNAVINNK